MQLHFASLLIVKTGNEFVCNIVRPHVKVYANTIYVHYVFLFINLHSHSISYYKRPRVIMEI